MSRGVIYNGAKVNGNLKKTILAEPETDTYDLRTFPDDFTWFNGNSTTYSIQETSGAGFSSFSITGCR